MDSLTEMNVSKTVICNYILRSFSKTGEVNQRRKSKFELSEVLVLRVLAKAQTTVVMPLGELSIPKKYTNLISDFRVSDTQLMYFQLLACLFKVSLCNVTVLVL